MNITVMDFSGIYDSEPWIREQRKNWISFRGLPGTDGYCTEEAAGEIRSAIADRPAGGVHFLDSGNYHYLSKFWLEKIERPFELIVFDRHSDMQPSALLPLISCGNWLLETLKENRYLQRVWLIGPSEETLGTMQETLRETEQTGLCVTGICGRSAHQITALWGEKEPDFPVYLSIDKDVLSRKEVSTNWDQGDMMIGELLRWICFIRRNAELLGADICGEPPGYGSPAGTDRDCLQSDSINRKLAEILT